MRKRVCIQLSAVLLMASAGYELTGSGGLESIGAIVIAGLSFREGREAFEKAKGNMECGCKKVVISGSGKNCDEKKKFD